jgi:Protein of unknown function (DUF3617)
MRASIITIAAAALTLAACGEADAPKGTASEQTVAAEMAEAKTMRAGQYEADVEFLRFDVPGMPESALAEARSQMEGATAVKNSYCLTEAAAARSQQDRLKDMGNAQGDCAFESFEVDGENVTGSLRCTGMPGGGAATMAMTGTMGDDASTVTITTTMTNPAVPQANATVEMRVTARRTGDCTAATRAEAERAEAQRQNRAAPAE